MDSESVAARVPFLPSWQFFVPDHITEGDLMTTLGAMRARFARNEGLPFADVLTEANLLNVLDEHGVKYRDRVFNPVTTLWGFLSQVLSDDHSCRDAVSRIIAHRSTQGIEACSPNTASYCNARIRLPTDVLRTLTRRTAQELQPNVPNEWKWHGCSVFIVDGSHVSMPDTVKNQATYPQTPTPKPGVGFPLARITVSLSLATGACRDLAIASYAGKGTGETTLMRKMYESLRPGDVVLADALFDNYFLICELRERGVDIVTRVKYERSSSEVIESGPAGDILVWKRPCMARGMTAVQYRTYLESLTMRRVHVDAPDRNNRAEQFDVITTILDIAITGVEIGGIYERRWCWEGDIRSIRTGGLIASDARPHREHAAAGPRRGRRRPFDGSAPPRTIPSTAFTVSAKGGVRRELTQKTAMKDEKGRHSRSLRSIVGHGAGICP